VSAVEIVRRHPRHLMLFALTAGLLLGPGVPAAAIVGAGVAALAAGRLPLALVAAVAVLGGATFAQARVEALSASGLAAVAGRTIDVRAILLEPVRTRRDGSAVARVRIAGRAALGRARSAGAPFHTDDLDGEVAVARAADGRVPEGVRVGSELRLRGSVAPLGEIDAYQRRRGAGAAVEVVSWEPTGRARGGLLGRLDAARERAARGLGTGLAAPEAALLRGMVLGQDEAIAPDVRDAFQRSGLAHLLAVSGQNVLLLCTLVLAICAVLDVPLRARLVAAAGLVAVYVPLAGGGPSIQRAGVMGIAGLVAALAGRPASRWYALGLAAALTLMLNPLAAGDPAWQLSFAAVAGLLALAPPLRQVLIRRRAPEPVADVAAITLAATLATGPLMALHFEQVSLASLPANLLAAPVVAPVMWLGMLGIAVAQIAPPLAAPLNVVCAPLLGYVQWVADGAAGAPLAAVPVRLGGATGLALAYAVPVAVAFALVRLRRAWPRLVASRSATPSGAAATGAWLPPVAGRDAAWSIGDAAGGLDRLRGAGARVRVAVAVLVATVAATVIALQLVRERPPPRARGELVVSFLDVGQGDAVLLQRDATSVLVDTGPPGGPILRRLSEAGVDRLDLLVLTHAEADHEGMALPVIAAHRPRMVLDGGAGWPTAVQHGLPAALSRTGGRALAAHAGQVLRIGAIRLRILWPPAPAAGWRPDGNPNDRAVVAHVQDGAFDLLLPADAETNVTAGLDLPRVEALKVAHHGSVDEGLPELLERTAPQVAAIEVGRNGYGHPAPSTLGALRVVPRLVRTDRDGTVRLRVADGRMRLDGGGGT
jgi:competence protein ComEC